MPKQAFSGNEKKGKKKHHANKITSWSSGGWASVMCFS